MGVLEPPPDRSSSNPSRELALRAEASRRRHRKSNSVRQRRAVASEARRSGVVDEPVDHGGGDDVVAEGLAQAEKGLLEMTISEARS
jgi:hypothetical protein